MKSGKCTYLEGVVQSIDDYTEPQVSGESVSSGTSWTFRKGDRYKDLVLKLPYVRLGLGFFGNRQEKRLLLRDIEKIVEDYLTQETPMSFELNGKNYSIELVDVQKEDVYTKVEVGVAWASGSWQGDIGAPATHYEDRRVPIYGDMAGTKQRFRLEIEER